MAGAEAGMLHLMAMNLHLAIIPLHLSFLDTLARRWLDAHPHAPDRGFILLPTRRAARSLATAFLNANAGRPMLLPRIVALGTIDEAPISLSGEFDLPPAVSAIQRNALLARMILKLPPERGGARSIDQAWMLAAELAKLLDEADRAELDLATALQAASAVEHALHWQTTLQFMDIVTHALPEVLAAMGVMNPVARQVRLLGLQAQQWETTPPTEPVWAAGLTGAIPSVARLMRVVAGLERGLVILPGLDMAMSDHAWEAMDDSHPQAGLARLLADISARRGDVAVWDGVQAVSEKRVDLFCTALLPAQSLQAWREPMQPDIAGLYRLSSADQQEEAAAVAMVLRDAIQTPNRRAALVTPDRDLAARVSAELLRWGVVADDSAGEALAAAPPTVFLRLLARAATEEFAPVALLSLMKHPLAAAGLAPATCREAARSLELALFRGPKPQPGLTSLKRLAEHAPAAARDLVYRLEEQAAPLLRVMAGVAVSATDALAALIAAAEALASTETVPGAERLWAGAEGDALAVLLAEASEALAGLPDQRPRDLPALLDALLAGAILRSRRALRGRSETEEHPRIFIWGLLEARLQSADLIVLGGLSEGVWPPTTDPGPWMSRPMRRYAGLPSPEVTVGQTAHDFVSTACAAPVVVLSCPSRRDSAPTVPSRWLARIAALLQGQKMALAEHPAARWVRLLDLPSQAPVPIAPPRPCPEVVLRPRRLSVTEIETLLKDPYAIYAKHVLRLRSLDPLEQSTDAADYGSLVHAGLHRFLSEVHEKLPPDARRRLREAMDAALLEADLRAALVAWWRPRLHRIAEWVVDEEILRRQNASPTRIASEATGDWLLPTQRGFTLRGRADRLEFRDDGSIAVIDYKTGTPPTQASVDAGFSPQLPLEAAMVEAGAFGPDMHGQVGALIYWHLTGGAEPGSSTILYKSDVVAIARATASASDSLVALLNAYDDPGTPYLAQPHPGQKPRFPQYAQLARVAEWDLAGQDSPT
jgi:ATP-dependent helicase/nuclease subunit B